MASNKKDAYYFSHDSNALTDPKILSMRCDYTLEGYGLYWAILEMLRNESEYKLPLNKNTFRAIKMQTATTINVEDFINDCINEYKDGENGNGLFNTDGEFFWSESLLKRMHKYEDIKQKRSEAGKKAMQNRWPDKQKDNNVITNIQKNNICYNKAITMLSKKKIKNSIKNSKNNKIITSVIKKDNKAITNVIKKYSNVITKNNKLNQIKSKEIKLKEIKSIYPYYHIIEENKSLDEMMDEMDKIEFARIIEKCEINTLLDSKLAIEIIEILKELFVNAATKHKIQQLNSKQLCYALKNYAIANTKSQIKLPKQYFKKCLLSALEQTELSTQYDTNTIYEKMESG